MRRITSEAAAATAAATGRISHAGLPVRRMALTAAHASHISRSRAYAHPVLLWPPRLQRVLPTEQVRTGTNPTQSQTSPASTARIPSRTPLRLSSAPTTLTPPAHSWLRAPSLVVYMVSLLLSHTHMYIHVYVYM